MSSLFKKSKPKMPKTPKVPTKANSAKALAAAAQKDRAQRRSQLGKASTITNKTPNGANGDDTFGGGLATKKLMGR